jgi:hypothetical protein
MNKGGILGMLSSSEEQDVEIRVMSIGSPLTQPLTKSLPFMEPKGLMP